MSVYAQTDASNNHKRMFAWNVAAQQLESVSKIIDRPQFSPLTSSAGRLIDAAAAIILGVDHADFDGQPAMRLEAAADRDAKGWYEFPLSEGELPELDWRPLFAGLLADQQRGVEPSVIAMRFHRSLVHGILRVCRQWREMPAVLSGGVFQNKLLTEILAEMHDEISTSRPAGNHSAQRRRSGRGATRHCRRKRRCLAMCLAIPGQVVELLEVEPPFTAARGIRWSAPASKPRMRA